MKRKGLMIYLTDHEKNLFTEHAKKHKKSISTTIKDLAISSIASSNIESPQPDNTEILRLKERIELLQNQLAETQIKDKYKRMVTQIYNSIKENWVSVDELYELFGEEDNEDFNIALHEFQEIYLKPQEDEYGDIIESEFEFNSFKNAYRRKL
jgi:hypothetical protein